MAKSPEELLTDSEREAKEKMDLPSNAENAAETVFESAETVCEGNESVYEDGATVYEDNATVYEDNATVYENDAADQTPASEPSYTKGETLLDTYTVAADPIHGGMGSVWRVHHNGWNVDLAMKRPQTKLFRTEEQKSNFIRECEAWINLGLHPNIVSCYYVREIDGVPTVFSEWMENGSLEDHIRHGTLYEGSEQEQQKRLLDIAVQFARGLHYAHEQGLIHQDVKPDNLLLTKDWDAKVADFGLARARAQLTVLDGTNTVSDTGTVMTPSGGYTPAYCSMEQMDGKLLTRRTDIYSWAVSVMETYVGSRPWMNGVVAGLSCQDYFADTKVPMPEALKTLLVKCMAAEPENRPHDFSEIESELLKIYRSVTGNEYPRPVSAAAADTADSLNNRALSMLDLGKTAEAEQLWKRALEENKAHLETVYNYSVWQWRKNELYDDDVLRRIEKYGSGNPVLQSDLIARVQALRGVTGLETDIKPAAEIHGVFREAWYLAFSRPDSARHAAICGVNTSFHWDTQTGACERIGEDRENRFFPYSGNIPDAEHLHFEKEKTVVRLVRPKDKKIFSTMDCNHIAYVGIAMSGSGRIAFSNYSVQLWDIGAQKPIFETDQDFPRSGLGIKEPCDLVAVSKDGRVVVNGNSKHVMIWNENGQLLSKIDAAPDADDITGVALNADGSLLLYGDKAGFLHLYAIGDCRQITKFRAHRGSVSAIRFDDSAGFAYTGGEDQMVRQWALSSERCICSYSCRGEVRDLAVSGDGKYVAAVSAGAGQMWKTRPMIPWHPVWELSRISSTEEILKQAERFKALMDKARALFEGGQTDGARLHLQQARTVPGYANAPECLDFLRSLGRNMRVTGVAAVNLKWEKTGLFHIDFEDDSFRQRAQVSPDERTLAAVSGRSVILYDANSGAEKQRIDTDSRYELKATAFWANGRCILAAGEGLLMFDVNSGAKVFDSRAEKVCFRNRTETIHISEDEKVIFAGADTAFTLIPRSNPPQLTLKRRNCLTKERALKRRFRMLYDGNGRLLPDTRRLAKNDDNSSDLFYLYFFKGCLSKSGILYIPETAGPRNILKRKDLCGCEKQLIIDTDEKCIQQATVLSPDERFLATVNVSGRIDLWNVENMNEKSKPVFSFASDAGLARMWFSNDGRYLYAVSSLGGLSVFEIEYQYARK